MFKIIFTCIFLILASSCSSLEKSQLINLKNNKFDIHHNGRFIKSRTPSQQMGSNILSITYLSPEDDRVPYRIKTLHEDLKEHNGQSKIYLVQADNGQDTSALPNELFEVGLQITRAPEFVSKEGKSYFTVDPKVKKILSSLISKKYVILNIYYSENVFAAVIDDNGHPLFSDFVNLFNTPKSILFLTRFADIYSIKHETEHLLQEKRGHLMNQLSYAVGELDKEQYQAYKRYLFEVNAYKVQYDLLVKHKKENLESYYKILEDSDIEDPIKKNETNDSYFTSRIEKIKNKSLRYRNNFYNLYSRVGLGLDSETTTCRFLEGLKGFEEKNFYFLDIDYRYDFINSICNL